MSILGQTASGQRPDVLLLQPTAQPEEKKLKQGEVWSMKPQHMPGLRQRTNVMPIIFTLVAPWIVFSVTFGTLSFTMHYEQPGCCMFICACGLFFVLLAGANAYTVFRRRWSPAGVDQAAGGWEMSLFILLAIGWVLGSIMGGANYWTNMKPYYDITNLNTYTSVNPTKMSGQQIMDAGRIVFEKGARLDLKKASGFKNNEQYCVAPITMGDTELAVYDMWAVGMNCCSGTTADFHCDDYKNENVHAGLRLMNDDAHGAYQYYRLAVQQAEGDFKIKASHPVFFRWVQDPIGNMNEFQDAGFKFFVFGMFTHFGFQLFIVSVGVLVFSKMGYKL